MSGGNFRLSFTYSSWRLPFHLMPLLHLKSLEGSREAGGTKSSRFFRYQSEDLNMGEQVGGGGTPGAGNLGVVQGEVQQKGLGGKVENKVDKETTALLSDPETVKEERSKVRKSIAN